MSDKLVCILEHPTQYDPPLWSRMAQRGKVEPIVWYLRGSVPTDGEIQKAGSWELPVDRKFAAEVISWREIVPRLNALSPCPKAILTAVGWKQKETWLAVRAGKRLGVPVILSTDKTIPEPSGLQALRRPISLWHRLKNRWCFDGFFTTGSQGVEALESTGVKRSRIARGLYPVDVRWWQANLESQNEKSRLIRQRVGVNAFVVLAVTKWAERENPLLILDAFSQLRKTVLEAYLVLVGDGPLRPAVEDKIRSASLQSSVWCPGYVLYQELASYYGAADVFLHVPKDGPWELSVLEAMACGVPVVATTNVGSAHDLVLSGKSGELAPPGDAEGLARALKSIADARGNKEAMRIATLDRAGSVDVDAASADLESLIERLQASRYSKVPSESLGVA
ncbi:MAG: glycosyltransferase [Gemmataceae bacterium]